MSSSGDVALKKTVDQLRREAALDRMKVSDACSDLQQYCMTNHDNDFLLTGLSAQGNPFKEKKACSIL